MVNKCERFGIKRWSDLRKSEVSGGKTHTKQLETGRMDTRGLFFWTFEVATYTKLLLTTGSSNHREFENIIYIGTGRWQYVSLQQEKKMGAVTID
jgi:hypothetical protein